MQPDVPPRRAAPYSADEVEHEAAKFGLGEAARLRRLGRVMRRLQRVGGRRMFGVPRGGMLMRQRVHMLFRPRSPYGGGAEILEFYGRKA